MAKVERFEDLEIWQLARVLVREIYELTRAPEFSKDYGLKDQIRRSSVSVMNNISEGFESRTSKLFINYLGQAKASCGETRSILYVALDSKYIGQDKFQELYDRCLTISRKIHRLMSYLDGYKEKSKVKDIIVEYKSNL